MFRRMIKDIFVGCVLIMVSKEMSVCVVFCLMVEKRIGVVLVVEGNYIVGIFIECDVFNKVLVVCFDFDVMLFF